MRYTITFREQEYNLLNNHLFSTRTTEQAAYALCKISQSENETRLLVRHIIPVKKEDIITASETGMEISNMSFIRAMKEADNTKHVFVFIHSHPKGFVSHSAKDDVEEAKLFKTAYVRIKTKGVHASIVLSDPDMPTGRVWLEDGTNAPIELTRVIGDKFKFYTDLTNVNPLPNFYDRQIRAFGSDMQKLLQVLNIGVVGVGGTGSAVTEQLIRLGVGTLTIVDGQKFEKTNVNRVYGSGTTDETIDKVVIAQNNSARIGLRTNIIACDSSNTYRSTIEKLKACDIVFGCTDDHWGRSILTRFAVYYHIPVFDMGVKIDSTDGEIKSIQGRVTTLLGGYACLNCRERINPKQIQIENLAELDPQQLQQLIKDGYAAELDDPAPAVIPFTTNIASLAIAEFIHRLTGFMGKDRKSNEVIAFFDDSKIRTNSRPSKPECFCGNAIYIMRGDVSLLLDVTWRKEKDEV